MPSILCTWLWVLAASGSFGYFPINGNELEPDLVKNPKVYVRPDWVQYDKYQLVDATFKSMSQFFGVDSKECGILILVATFISSPISAFFALTGSIVSLLTGICLGVDPNYLYSGQWNESAVLTSIAIGSIFFVPNSWKHIFFTVLGAIFSSIIQGAIIQLVRPFGMPPLNIAFNLTTWFWILAG